MELDGNQFKPDGENARISGGNHFTQETEGSPVNDHGNKDGDKQIHEADLQDVDTMQMVLDDTPPHDHSPTTHGLPTLAELDTSNDDDASPTNLNNNNAHFNVQTLALDNPANGYSSRGLHGLPSFGDGSSRYTGASFGFNNPQQGLNTQFDVHNFNNSWTSVNASLPMVQSDSDRGPQGNQDPFEASYATQQQPPFGNQGQNLGLFQTRYPPIPDYNTSLNMARAAQRYDIHTGTQPTLPPKRRPGRPQGGSLPKRGLITRMPAQYGDSAYTTQGGSSFATLVNSPTDQNEEHDLVDDQSKTASGKNKGIGSTVPNTPANQTVSSTSTPPLIKIHAGMTPEELRKAKEHNLGVQLQKADANRNRNNMSAKRGRYRRMACTIAVMDEVYRLRLEVQRAHEELHAEKMLKASLLHQMQSAGIQPALPPSPATTGMIRDGTLLGALAAQQGFGGNHDYSDDFSLPPLPTMGLVYGTDGNGKFHLPTDHLALTESWCRRAETTREELLADMPQKIAPLEGGCLEEMQSVIDKGNKIRAMLANHNNNGVVPMGQPDWEAEIMSPTPGLLKNTIGKRKARTAAQELEVEEDDGSSLRRSTRKTARHN